MFKIQKLFATIGIVLIIGIIMGVGGYFYGKSVSEDQTPTIEVTPHVILEKITDQYFVVTKTLFLDEEILIEADQGSDWNNLLWGQSIVAEGTVRVDVGVDMNKLEESDIEVNETTKTITLDLPEAEILDASLNSDLIIDTKNGILKAIFDNNQGEDYNRAVTEMLNIAKKGVEEDKELLNDAQIESIKLITIILNDLDYTVEFK